MSAYRIFTDATCDMNEEMLTGIPEISIIPMNVRIADRDYVYGPDGTIDSREFYDLQRKGCFGNTSQINAETYKKYMEPVLEAGEDIIYICLTTGLSGTYQSALLCREELVEKFPDRKIIFIDSLCAAAGMGFLVREAALKKAEGMDIEGLEAWINSRRLKVCHWFTVDVFEHLKHGGRVSGFAAALGTTLQIKPLLHVDEEGRLQVAGKPRGRKKAMAELISRMEKGWQKELGSYVLVAHGDDPEAAAQLVSAIEARFPEASIQTTEIGPVIGCHTGPGMLAVLFWGSER